LKREAFSGVIGSIAIKNDSIPSDGVDGSANEVKSLL